MSFVPAFFGKLGRTSNDLLTQKFDERRDDFRNKVSLKSQANGVTITTTGTEVGDKKIEGKVNVTYDDKSFGQASVEYGTHGKSKYTLRLSKLQPGLTIAGEAEMKNTFSTSVQAKVNVDYAQENFAGSLEYSQAKNKAITSAVYGVDGLSFGVSGIADVNKITNGAPILDAVLAEVGAQYEDGSLVSTLTFDADKQVNLSLFHRISPDLQVASKFTTNPSKHSLTLGSQYKLSSATVVKGRTTIHNDQSYTIYGFIQHRLANPNLTVGVSGSTDSANKNAIGFTLSFGDH